MNKLNKENMKNQYDLIPCKIWISSDNKLGVYCVFINRDCTGNRDNNCYNEDIEVYCK